MDQAVTVSNGDVAVSQGREPAVTVIIPTFNEAENIGPLLHRLNSALTAFDAQVLFIDDSTDTTVEQIHAGAREASIPVRVLRRPSPRDGLGGAVLLGLRSTRSRWCVVMDADLQHPPELIPVLLRNAARSDVDLVIASRHVPGGSSAGLANRVRRVLSSGSTDLLHILFPRRLADVTDPLSGFFAVRRSAIALHQLRPRGFKILLEIVLRNRLRTSEVPLVLGVRHAGYSKGDLRQGLRLTAQIAILRVSSLKALWAGATPESDENYRLEKPTPRGRGF